MGIAFQLLGIRIYALYWVNSSCTTSNFMAKSVHIHTTIFHHGHQNSQCASQFDGKCQNLMLNTIVWCQTSKSSSYCVDFLQSAKTTSKQKEIWFHTFDVCQRLDVLDYLWFFKKISGVTKVFAGTSSYFNKQFPNSETVPTAQQTINTWSAFFRIIHSLRRIYSGLRHAKQI